jgi:hypothetical protein
MSSTDQDDEQIESLPAPASDRYGDTLTLLAAVTNPKAARKQVLARRRWERDQAAAEQRLAAVIAQAEQINAKLDARAAELDARDRASDEREAAFERQAAAVRDEQREYGNHLEQVHRRLAHRLMATVGILGEWNWNLQSPPSWAQLRQMIAGLPEDLPAAAPEPAMRIDAFSDVCSDPGADRHGNAFLGSLNRDVEHKRKSAA